MVTHAEVSLDGPHRATLRQNGERLHVELLSGGDTAFEIFEIEKPPQDYDAPNPGAKMLGFKLNLNPESDRRIAVALIPGNVSEVEIEFSEMRDW